ncbi:albumin-like [Paroedura picta]|uniref:albumin-like n=1 Tax=Paroedura picta TaxID=143630 RepID=UPI004055CAB2
MQWLVLLALALLAGPADAKHLPRRARDAGHRDSIGHCFAEIPEEDFKGIALVSFVHYVPNITYEAMEKMVHDLTELGKKCAADEHAIPECAKSVDVLIREELCHEPSVAEHYGFSECCGKTDHDRNECLLSHRNETPDSSPPYKRPEPEEACKAFQDDRLQVLGHFLFGIARRHSGASILALFHTAAQFEEGVIACCQAEDKAACFNEKITATQKRMKEFILVEKQNCFLLKKFGPKQLQTLKFVQVVQRLPKEERSILHNISAEIVHIHEERCKGDTLESFFDQLALTKYVCGHQEITSPNLKRCCQQPLLHRPFCFLAMDNDEPPADLSPTVREFVDNKEVCQHYAENHDAHEERFSYEYARRHQELSPQALLRIKKGYHDLLEKCCQLESPEECLSGGEAMLRKHVADTLEVIRTNCELYANLGDYKFKNVLLSRYAKKAPQMSFEELDKYTEQLLGVARKCCAMEDKKKMTCSEGYTDLVLGSICLRHQEHAINHKICQCCSGDYAFRRECFTAIEVDDGYTPGPCAPELFALHEDLCTANAEAENRKPKLLVNLVKCKPAITVEQLKAVTADFYGVVAKCCHAESHEQCFHEEGPKLVERTQAALN